VLALLCNNFSSALGDASAIRFLSQESDDAKKQRFNKFKSDNGKSYKDANEESQRYQIFAGNLAVIDERNRLEGAMVHGITKFSDISGDEFAATYLTRKSVFQATANELKSISKPSLLRSGNNEVKLEATNVDWTTQGRTTPIKNQGSCGSCWAFGITEQIESDTIRLLGKTYLLAPQQVVDCDTNNGGCNGGNEGPALSYVQTTAGGICQEADYPYTSGSVYPYAAGTCKTSTVNAKKVVGLQSYSRILGETNVANFVTNTGPVTIAVDATNWNSYTGNVMTSASCSYGHASTINHVVQAVGLYIPTSGQAYWKVRNQWGSNWGLSGYILLAYGSNTCNMASDYSYYTTPKLLTSTTSVPTTSTRVPTASTLQPTLPTASLAPSFPKPSALPTSSTKVPVAVPTFPNPTAKPSSGAPTTVSGTWQCPSYSIPTGWYLGLPYTPCTIYACPGTVIKTSSCPSQGGAFSGDTYAVLLNSYGTQVAYNDDASYGSMCSTLQYTVPSTATCTTYTLAETCYPLAQQVDWYGNVYYKLSCSGTFVVSGASSKSGTELPVEVISPIAISSAVVITNFVAKASSTN